MRDQVRLDFTVGRWLPVLPRLKVRREGFDLSGRDSARRVVRKTLVRNKVADCRLSKNAKARMLVFNGGQPESIRTDVENSTAKQNHQAAERGLRDPLNLVVEASSVTVLDRVCPLK